MQARRSLLNNENIAKNKKVCCPWFKTIKWNTLNVTTVTKQLKTSASTHTHTLAQTLRSVKSNIKFELNTKVNPNVPVWIRYVYVLHNLLCNTHVYFDELYEKAPIFI